MTGQAFSRSHIWYFRPTLDRHGSVGMVNGADWHWGQGNEGASREGGRANSDVPATLGAVYCPMDCSRRIMLNLVSGGRTPMELD